jgi:hypothetical protein
LEPSVSLAGGRIATMVQGSTVVRVGAVQLNARLADVDYNLAACERLAGEGARQGAEWIVLPEFFSTAIAFDDRLARAALPTMWENSFYTGGERSDVGIHQVRGLDVGIAMRWEPMRTQIARRLRANVGHLEGGATIADATGPCSPNAAGTRARASSSPTWPSRGPQPRTRSRTGLAASPQRDVGVLVARRAPRRPSLLPSTCPGGRAMNDPRCRRTLPRRAPCGVGVARFSSLFAVFERRRGRRCARLALRMGMSVVGEM